ncbi:UNVERIFIED_CONTAM: hypothetical protein GTU68_019472 [Idotea baltica]|nr:hypothetical protein [Idotea baltica]
MVLFFFLPR